jgi:hypothetical protein
MSAEAPVHQRARLESCPNSSSGVARASFPPGSFMNDAESPRKNLPWVSRRQIQADLRKAHSFGCVESSINPTFSGEGSLSTATFVNNSG